jgi:hypothetical protein
MGYEDLRAIIEEARQTAQQEANQPPVACPIDGHVLDVHPDGRRNCPLGNYTYTG